MATAIVSKCEGLPGCRHKPPRAFTEDGAIMAASVLNSPRAIEMSVYVVRAFVQQREAIADILKTIRELMTPPEPPHWTIGFIRE